MYGKDSKAKCFNKIYSDGVINSVGFFVSWCYLSLPAIAVKHVLHAPRHFSFYEKTKSPAIRDVAPRSSKRQKLARTFIFREGRLCLSAKQIQQQDKGQGNFGVL